MGVSTFDCWDRTTPVDLTVALDTTGDLQTVVGSFVWNAQTNLTTFTLPVLPADWEALLTPAVNDGQDLGAPGQDRHDLELARLQRDRLPVPPLTLMGPRHDRRLRASAPRRPGLVY